MPHPLNQFCVDFLCSPVSFENPSIFASPKIHLSWTVAIMAYSITPENIFLSTNRTPSPRGGGDGRGTTGRYTGISSLILDHHEFFSKEEYRIVAHLSSSNQ